MNNNLEILIVSGAAEDCELIVGQVSKNYQHVHTALDNKLAVEMFEKFKPQLIFVAFDKLEYSEHFYLYLYRNSSTIVTHPHQIILMCPAPESKKASQLCANDIFDDYIVYKPAYDIYRIDLAILHAIKRLETDPNILNSNFAAYSGLAASLHASIKDSVSETSKAKAISEKSHDTLRQVISSHMDEFGHLLTKQGGKSGTDGQVTALLKQFEHEKIMPELNSAYKEVDDALTDLVESRETAYQQFDESVKEAQELIPDVSQTILLIDDDEMFLTITASVLEPEGFEVLSANDAKKGLSLMLKQKPDLVIVDFNMPGRNGIELIQTAKSNPHLVHIPFIMMTGHSQKDTIAAVLKAGASDFIVKPTGREVLLAKVKKHLKHPV